MRRLGGASLRLHCWRSGHARRLLGRALWVGRCVRFLSMLPACRKTVTARSRSARTSCERASVRESGDSGASALALSSQAPACAPAGRATRPLSVEGAVFAFCAVSRCHAARAGPRPRRAGLAPSVWRSMLHCQSPPSTGTGSPCSVKDRLQRSSAVLSASACQQRRAASAGWAWHPARVPKRTRRRAKKASSCSGVVSVTLMAPAACAARSSAASSRMLSTAGTAGHVCVSLRGRCGVACGGIVLARWCRNWQRHRK